MVSTETAKAFERTCAHIELEVARAGLIHDFKQIQSDYDKRRKAISKLLEHILSTLQAASTMGEEDVMAYRELIGLLQPIAKPTLPTLAQQADEWARMFSASISSTQ
jgi:hypothetical protein